jgi:hypothetical protein
MEQQSDAVTVENVVTSVDRALEHATANGDGGQDVNASEDGNESNSQHNINPQQIYQIIREKGSELHELLQIFRNVNSKPLLGFIL